MEISLIGVIVGLVVAVVMITMKLSPVMSLFLGAVTGALVGGASIGDTLQNVIIWGGQSVMGVNVRITVAGVLAGVLIESGAAEVIARTIVDKLGAKRAVLSMTLSCMILTGVGIFNTISIVMLSPLALSVGQKTNISKISMLLALSGGSKAGNILSPNPNAVAVAEGFNLTLSEVMVGGFIPGLVALVVTVFIASRVKLMNRGPMVAENEVDKVDTEANSGLPSFAKAVSGPAVAVCLLVISPIGNILGIEALRAFQIDSFFILPFAGVVGALIMGKRKQLLSYINAGVMRMMPVTLLLTGAGAIGGLIQFSVVPSMLADGIIAVGLPGFILAPVSSALMGSATGSAVTGAILATNAFAETLTVGFGVEALAAAVMLHAGCMFIDVMPHGNIFLASRESMKMEVKDRMFLVPLEAAIGGIMMLSAIIMYGVIL